MTLLYFDCSLPNQLERRLSVLGNLTPTSFSFLYDSLCVFKYAALLPTNFALLLATIPSFHGYYMKGGALEVGQASTVSFVWTSVVIILMNFILTQLLLS